MNHSKSTPNIFLEEKQNRTASSVDPPRMTDNTSARQPGHLTCRTSFESCISTTSTSKVHATSIFSSSNGNGSDGDDEEEDFLYNSSATDQDTPQVTFTLPIATSLKRKYSHRSIAGHHLFKKKTSYGTLGIRTRKSSLALAPPTPPRVYDQVTHSFSSRLSASEETRLFDYPDLEPGADIEMSKNSRMKMLVGSLIFFSVIVLTAIGLVTITLQPLRSIGVTSVTVITRTVHLFELNMLIEGYNPNIVSINLNETDLDVFASQGINTHFQISNISSAMNLANVNTLLKPAQEILGHVRSFNSSIDQRSFKPLSNQSIHPRISIIDPSNTLGRFIYMNFPFTILIRGEISYTTPLDLVKYTIPVCIFQHLLSKENVSTYSCL